MNTELRIAFRQRHARERVAQFPGHKANSNDRVGVRAKCCHGDASSCCVVHRRPDPESYVELSVVIEYFLGGCDFEPKSCDLVRIAANVTNVKTERVLQVAIFYTDHLQLMKFANLTHDDTTSFENSRADAA